MPIMIVMELYRRVQGADGSKVIVNEAAKSEYEEIWNSKTEPERYTITEDEVSTVIYGKS